MQGKKIVYAGLWRRIQAWIVDLILVMLTTCTLALIVAIALFFTFGLTLKDKNQLNTIYSLSGAAIGLITYFSYFIGFEVSKLQATPGKLLLNIKVTDMNRERIGYFRAFFRLISKLLSGFLLGIGFIICDFTAQKQALHDIIANTLVVRKEEVVEE